MGLWVECEALIWAVSERLSAGADEHPDLQLSASADATGAAQGESTESSSCAAGKNACSSELKCTASWIWPTPGEGSLGYMWDSPTVLDDGTSMKGCKTGHKMLFQGYLRILRALRSSGAGDTEHLLTKSSGFSTAWKIHILLLISPWISALLPLSCNPCQYPA